MLSGKKIMRSIIFYIFRKSNFIKKDRGNPVQPSSPEYNIPFPFQFLRDTVLTDDVLTTMELILNKVDVRLCPIFPLCVFNKIDVF